MKKGFKSAAMLLALVMALNPCAAVLAQEQNRETTKDETVYAFLDENGSFQYATVTEWLHNDQGLHDIEDQSDLKDIRNLNGDEQPVIDGSKLTWNSEASDIYYQGTSTAPLPLSMEVSYKFNGKAVNVQDIVGQSGELEVDIRIINHLEKTQNINGKVKTISTLFPCVLLTDLAQDKFANVEADNGMIIAESKNQLVVFTTVSGISTLLESSALDLPEELEDSFRDTFTIRCEVTDFEMPSIMMAAIPLSGEDTDLFKSESLDKMSDGVKKLKDAAVKIMDGSAALYDANSELDHKMGEFKNEYETLASGLSTAASSSAQLAEGAKQLNDGVVLMKQQLNALLEQGGFSSEQVQQLLVRLNEALTQLENASAMMETLSSSMAALSTMPQAVAQGIREGADEETINQVLGNAESAVSEQVMAALTQQEIALGFDLSEASGAVQGAVYDTLLQCGVDEETAAAASAQAAEQIMSSLQGAVDGKVEAAKQTIRESMKQAAAAGISAMKQGAAQADVLLIDALAQNVQNNLQLQVDQMSTTLQQAEQLLAQMQQMLVQFDGILMQLGGQEGISELFESLQAVPAKIDELNAGTEQLSQGTLQLQKGLEQLDQGSKKVQDALAQFKDATALLASKTGELSAGVREFNQDGIEVLNEQVDNAIGSLDEAVEAARSALDQSAEYQSYAKAGEQMEASVKFIMKTAEVKKAPVQKSETTEPVQEKLSLWERIKNLFTK